MHELYKTAAREAIAAGDTLRVATANIWFDERNWQSRYEDLSTLFKELECDIVLIQEVPHGRCEEALAILTSNNEHRVGSIAPASLSINAVLTKHPGEAEAAVEHHEKIDGKTLTTTGAVFVFERRGWRIRVSSVHQPWGGTRDIARLRSAATIDRELSLRASCDATIIGGDFNAESTHDSIRYIIGRAAFEGRNAHWTDAWATAGEGDGTTSSPENVYARMVGEGHGFLDPRMLPERRIDYIFTKGYAYGSLGTPLRAFTRREGVEGRPYPSDHWMVVADLYLPQKGGTQASG